MNIPDLTNDRRVRVTVSAHVAVMDDHPSGAGRRLLMVRLNYRDHRRGRWSFPGGYVDAGEGLEAALRREVLEEVGLTLSACTRIAVVPLLEIPRPHIGFVFHCDRFSGHAELRSRELLEVRWIDRAEVEAIISAGELAYPEMRDQLLNLDWDSCP